jgi:ribonuclease Z
VRSKKPKRPNVGTPMPAKRPKIAASQQTRSGMHPGLPPACRTLYVRAVALRHSVPTSGYVFADERKRLLPEYAARREADPVQFQTDIGALRKSGTQVDGLVKVPLLAFLCDCTSDSATAAIDELCREDAPQVIMVECTFIDDADAEQATKRRHVLWSKLRPTLQQYPDVIFLLIHFSNRYTAKGVLETFARGLPENVHAFI